MERGESAEVIFRVQVLQTHEVAAIIMNALLIHYFNNYRKFGNLPCTLSTLFTTLTISLSMFVPYTGAAVWYYRQQN